MRRILGRMAGFAALAATVAIVGCRDAAGPDPTTRPPDKDLLSPPTGLLNGNLKVKTSTSGSDLDPDGYTVTVDDHESKSIDANGSVTFTEVATGTHSVRLTDVAGNCSVEGSNPRTVVIVAQLTTSTEFAVHCEAKEDDEEEQDGDLTVTTSTTGSDLDPDGYTVTVDDGESRPIGVDDEVTFQNLSAGEHRVGLSGVADNCSVSDSNPRTVTVPAGGAGSTTFTVTCDVEGGEAGTTAQGFGAIGDGPAEPGGDRQEFDFDVTDAPGGRMSVTDYSVVRSNGNIGRMFADSAVDPETFIDSFTRTSATCVRFGGVGRLDTGELWDFFIDACDNGSPGAGADTYTVTLPDRSGPGNPFVRGGTLTEGEIVIE